MWWDNLKRLFRIGRIGGICTVRAVAARWRPIFIDQMIKFAANVLDLSAYLEDRLSTLFLQVACSHSEMVKADGFL